MKNPIRKPSLITLILLAGYASFNAMLAAPATPQIAHGFNISNSDTQFIMTIFLLGYVFGQLIYGPLSNRYGRIPSLLTGLGIGFLGAIVCILSGPLHSFTLLLIGRFFSAVGTCAGLVLSYTMVSDYYPPQQARKLYATLSIAFSVLPGVATVLGGVLAQYLGWESCFYFLGVSTLILFFLSSRLPETVKTRDPHALKPLQIIKNYSSMLTHKSLMCNALVYGMSTACIYIYAAESPVIGINIIGLSASVFGIIAMLPYVTNFLGSISASPIGQVLDEKKSLKLGFALELFASLTLFILFFFGIINIYSLFIPIFIIMFAHPIIITNTSSIAMSAVEDRSNASAMFNCVSMFPALVGTFLLTALHSNSALVLPILFLIMMVFYAVFYKIGYAVKKI